MSYSGVWLIAATDPRLGTDTFKFRVTALLGEVELSKTRQVMGDSALPLSKVLVSLSDQ